LTFQKRMPPVGARPGTLAIPADSPAPRIHVFDYDAETCREAAVEDPGELAPYLESSHKTWVDVQGFGDEAKLRKLGDLFGFHPLTLEGAVNVPQRASNQVGPDHQLIIARAPILSRDGLIEVPQVCMILGPNYLLTMQDRYFGFFDAVRSRLRDGPGRPIRRLGPDYLAYALLDALVDHYFPIVEHLATELEELEEEVSEDPGHDTLTRLHEIRRNLVIIRRVGWPQREALRHIIHENSPFISAEAQVFLRHAEQHITQIMEAVDSSREMTNGLVDIYLSNVSQRTNEVMKVLTLMASIFIPLTFIAGIYGMNFESMPELHNPLGYPLALGLMAAVAGGMIYFFWRRGWLGSRRAKK
jgi:magnesium transporter